MTAYADLKALRQAAHAGADALSGDAGIRPGDPNAIRHAELLAEARAYNTALEVVRDHDQEATS